MRPSFDRFTSLSITFLMEFKNGYNLKLLLLIDFSNFYILNCWTGCSNVCAYFSSCIEMCEVLKELNPKLLYVWSPLWRRFYHFVGSLHTHSEKTKQKQNTHTLAWKIGNAFVPRIHLKTGETCWVLNFYVSFRRIVASAKQVFRKKNSLKWHNRSVLNTIKGRF